MNDRENHSIPIDADSPCIEMVRLRRRISIAIVTCRLQFI